MRRSGAPTSTLADFWFQTSLRWIQIWLKVVHGNFDQWGLHRLAEAVALPSQFSKRTWGSSDANEYQVLAEQSYINSVNSLAWWNFKASCLERFSWMANGRTRNCWCHVRIIGLQLRDSWWIACPKSFNRLVTFIAFKRIQYHSMMYRWLEKLQLGL